MQQDSGAQARRALQGLTVGLDLSDTHSTLCVIDAEGEELETGRVRTRTPDLLRRFSALPPSRVVLEVGTHSPWVSRLLSALGHEVVVANPRRVRLIAQGERKTDRADAETLARLGRIDPALLAPVRHRGAQAQADLAVLRGRDALVRARSLLINHVRGAVKALGGRLPGCSAEAFHHRAPQQLPAALRPALLPLVEQVGALSTQIRDADRALEALCARYPETALLRQVRGVGPVTALAFVLTLEDPQRFRESRDVGPYLGLTPRQRQSGARSPQLRISKAGDAYLRRLLVGCARYVLGPFGEDCDLRRWGLRRAPAGASRALRNRTAIGVARRLAVVLHRLWVTGEVYEPLRLARAAATA
jgi:transposase